MNEFLEAGSVSVPSEFMRHARRFLYYQLFRTSLPFGDFLEPSVRTTQARLKSFDLNELTRSPAIQAVSSSLFEGGDFLLREAEPGPEEKFTTDEHRSTRRN